MAQGESSIVCFDWDRWLKEGKGVRKARLRINARPVCFYTVYGLERTTGPLFSPIEFFHPVLPVKSYKGSNIGT